MNVIRASKRLLTLAALSVGIALLAQPVHAGERVGLRACYGVVTFGRETKDIRLMQVTTKAQRLPFYKDRTEKTPHCPAEIDLCQLKTFLVPGDLVLAGPDMEDFTCATYISPEVRRLKGQFRLSLGFIPLSELREVKVASPSPAQWSGTWYRSAEAEIRIGQDDAGKLTILGRATYGAHNAERVKRGAVNVGELGGTVAIPKANMLALGDGYDGTKPMGNDRSECRAKLRLFGPYLVVEDNGGCGGNNVSFTGIYVKLKAQ